MGECVTRLQDDPSVSMTGESIGGAASQAVSQAGVRAGRACLTEDSCFAINILRFDSPITNRK